MPLRPEGPRLGALYLSPASSSILNVGQFVIPSHGQPNYIEELFARACCFVIRRELDWSMDIVGTDQQTHGGQGIIQLVRLNIAHTIHVDGTIVLIQTGTFLLDLQ